MRTRHFSSSDSVSPRLDEARSAESARSHRPVLLHEVLDALEIQHDDIVVDATIGSAGHAREIVKGLGGNGLFIGFDMDRNALERSRSALADARAKTCLVNADFRHLERELKKLGIAKITKALFDLGWSSTQLDSGRGFSFLVDEPLLMTYSDVSAHGKDTLTAEIVVNTWSERTLADIMYGFGEERYARRIAKAIVERRRKKPFRTSRELAETVALATPARYRHGPASAKGYGGRSRIHPATRTFQALRIAVNDELGALSEGLEAAWKMTRPKGRIAVISFHSVEDRIVKRMFADLVKKGEGRLLVKKPMSASRKEVRENPRARSAKLRVIEKVEQISYEGSHSKNKQIRSLGIPRED